MICVVCFMFINCSCCLLICIDVYLVFGSAPVVVAVAVVAVAVVAVAVIAKTWTELTQG